MLSMEPTERQVPQVRTRTPVAWQKFETCPDWGAKSQNSRRDSNSHPHVHQWLMVPAEGGATSLPYWGGIIHEPAPIGTS